MESALLGARLLLAVVFAAAAAGKVRDRAGFGTALAGFGVPAGLISLLGVVVPAVELVTAGLLLPVSLAPVGAALASGLLGVFTLAVVLNLARGRAPDCRCFGGADPAPIGGATLARNGALLVAALSVMVLGPGAGGPALAEAGMAGGLALLAVPALGALGWLAGREHARAQGLARRVATLTRQLADAEARDTVLPDAGLPPGTPAPAFDLPLLAGDRATLTTLTASGRPVLLLFSSAHCPSCAELWSDVGRWQTALRDRVAVTVVATGSAMAIEMKLMGTGVRDAVLAEGTDVEQQYRVAGVPSAVVVGADGTIASETVMGPAAVRDLVRRRFEA
jgi:uncharacterized membrane protein YphA (DoxX/SURF4 family)